MPGSPPSAGTTRPESSAKAGKPVASAAACALSAAFASKVAPVSSGSATPSASADESVTPKGAISAAISRSLPGLWVARTRRSPAKARGVRPGKPDASGETERQALRSDQLADPLMGKLEHASKACLVERTLLGGGLDLDDRPGTGQHEIAVGMGRRILDIVEIEHGDTVMDAARHRRDGVGQRQRGDELAGDQFLQRHVQGDIAAGDRRRARPAIGLEDVAIDADLPLAERLQIGDGAQRPADQALNFLGAAALLAARRLAVGA